MDVLTHHHSVSVQYHQTKSQVVSVQISESFLHGPLEPPTLISKGSHPIVLTPSEYGEYGPFRTGAAVEAFMFPRLEVEPGNAALRWPPTPNCGGEDGCAGAAVSKAADTFPLFADPFRGDWPHW
jgi:hypothetical protein